jgi:hypothetical protein
LGEYFISLFEVLDILCCLAEDGGLSKESKELVILPDLIARRWK